MIAEYIRYTVPAEHSSAFEDAYAHATGTLDQDEHCLAHEVTRCAEDAPTRPPWRRER